MIKQYYIFRKWELKEAVKPIKSPRPATMQKKRRKEKETRAATTCGDFKEMVEGGKTQRETKARRREEKERRARNGRVGKLFF
jgi:hypothetical protein